MKCPDWLDDNGKEFWKFNAPLLQEQGKLDDHNYYPFINMCKHWSVIQRCDPLALGRESINYFAASKGFAQLAKEFGLTPKSANHSQLQDLPIGDLKV